MELTSRHMVTCCFQVFKSLLEKGMHENDLSSRVQISTTRNENDNGFTSTLTIWNQTRFDEGYYTCWGINQNKEKINSFLYIFFTGKTSIFVRSTYHNYYWIFIKWNDNCFFTKIKIIFYLINWSELQDTTFSLFHKYKRC